MLSQVPKGQIRNQYFLDGSSKSVIASARIVHSWSIKSMHVHACLLHASRLVSRLDTISTLMKAEILPPSQNIRHLSISQKSIFFKFDQVYTYKYG
jgi:hypothetical protein